MTQVTRVDLPLPVIVRTGGGVEASQPAIDAFLKRANTVGVPMEVGVPQRKEWMTSEDWFHRFATCDENRVCGLITNAEVDYERHCIVADLRAFGPFGEVLPHAIKPDPTLTLRVRAFTKAGNRAVLQQIATWDVVDKRPDEWVRKMLGASPTRSRDYFQLWTEKNNDGSVETGSQNAG